MKIPLRESNEYSLFFVHITSFCIEVLHLKWYNKIYIVNSIFLCVKVYFTQILFTEDQLLKKVAVIMGSDSDFDVVKGAIDTLKEYNVEYEAHVMSAHRTPDIASEFAKNAEKNGFGVIIAAAGKAAHLAGAFAAHSTLPVIGIPLKSSEFDGLDALLSTVQMPPGMPVATVAVNGASNAALLAVQILALEDKELNTLLKEKRQATVEKTIKKDMLLQERLKGEF